MKVIQLREDFSVIVDDDDVSFLERFKYRPHNGGYAIRAGREGEPKTCSLHRDVMAAPKGIDVDHINGVRHDCRKENLRLATRQQNNWNGAGYPSRRNAKYKGVVTLWQNRPRVQVEDGWTVESKAKQYAARIRRDGKTVHLGVFETQEEAAIAYDAAALQQYGEFARLNFPQVRELMQIHAALKAA